MAGEFHGKSKSVPRKRVNVPRGTEETWLEIKWKLYTSILGKINVSRGTKGKMTAVDDEYFKDIYQGVVVYVWRIPVCKWKFLISGWGNQSELIVFYQ